MRCSCKHCGTYMVQTERGLFSGCKCPECGNMCRDCMGSVEGPFAPDQLKDRFLVGAAYDEIPEEVEEPGWDELRADWKKML